VKQQNKDLRHALALLRNNITRVAEVAGIAESMDIQAWGHMLDTKLLPRISPDFPLMAAVCGGGSSGKSTLFNSLAGEKISPVGGTAGMNRRVLVSLHPQIPGKKDFLSAMFDPFGCVPNRLNHAGELTEPGGPLYAATVKIPRRLVVMDTPDFDTGAGGTYTNRETTQQALQAADILIYIFTNSNYNNRDNTDFISKMLTGIGTRKCFLVYRTYPSFTEEEVLEHADVVARNLYGRKAEENILGIYRADEDNAVAAGERHMTLKPARKGDPGFLEALKRIEHVHLRQELVYSILQDVLGKASDVLKAAEGSTEELKLYLDALQTVQSHCVHQALHQFPMGLVLKRFMNLWYQSDPPFLKAMRRTGDIIELPLKMLMGAVKWLKQGKASIGEKESESREFVKKVEEDLLGAINSLYARATGSEISVLLPVKDPVARRMRESVDRIRQLKSGLGNGKNPRTELVEKQALLSISTEAHPAILRAQQALRQREWKSILSSILEKKEIIFIPTQEIDRELALIVRDFRKKITFWNRVGQTFSAILNVLPATAAITYVLHTGDPMGAAGIKIKLTGLFGLHDLYALIAIPATTGMKKADRKRMEAMLVPVAQTWLENKLRAVQQIFEKEMTGGMITAGKQSLDELKGLNKEIKADLEFCIKANVTEL
jgi:hypothetical protein